ncbi:hypothetical protein ACHAW5_003806 [Stephanodiscus triporus]|uniref:Vesicle-fusing ATPase n=1 Tax=Stephanodiscus triporus TaxID=2934178 RepID=A0ABD3MU28_9STRA
MDAISKSRGANRSNSGVSDSVVYQLLSKIDGVDSLNNILLIGMTNRKDTINDALLHPGRLEVHIEIGLTDHKGRLQILGIHTKSMASAFGGLRGVRLFILCRPLTSMILLQLRPL